MAAPSYCNSLGFNLYVTLTLFREIMKRFLWDHMNIRIFRRYKNTMDVTVTFFDFFDFFYYFNLEFISRENREFSRIHSLRDQEKFARSLQLVQQVLDLDCVAYQRQ